jgi:hypothetical protein
LTIIEVKADHARRLAGLDLLAMATLIAVIIRVIRIYKSCTLSPAEACGRMRSPSRLERFVLRRFIRQELRRLDAGCGFRVADIEKAVLAVGSDATEQDVSAMYWECGGPDCHECRWRHGG